MTGLALAAIGMAAYGAAALLLLYVADRTGQAALRRYREAHRSGWVLWERTEEDVSRWLP